jgi:hypothetical protein
MFRLIVAALSGLILYLGLAYDGAAQQAPSAGAQPPVKTIGPRANVSRTSNSAGQTVRVTNAGGEGHTFTEVAAFGGGFVPFLNGVGGPAGTVPLVEARACQAAPASVVVPGNTVHSTGFPPGCISPSAASIPGCAL